MAARSNYKPIMETLLTLQTTINTDAGTTSFVDPWNENIRLRCLDNTNDAAPSEFQFSCGN